MYERKWLATEPFFYLPNKHYIVIPSSPPNWRRLFYDVLAAIFSSGLPSVDIALDRVKSLFPESIVLALAKGVTTNADTLEAPSLEPLTPGDPPPKHSFPPSEKTGGVSLGLGPGPEAESSPPLLETAKQPSNDGALPSQPVVDTLPRADGVRSVSSLSLFRLELFFAIEVCFLLPLSTSPPLSPLRRPHTSSSL